jgi:hypothetical protein
LQVLELRDTSVGVPKFSGLGKLPVLRHADFSGSPIGDDTLGFLETTVPIEVLLLAGTRVTSTGLRGIDGNRSLRELDLSNAGVDSLDFLPRDASLTELRLANTYVSDAGLAVVASRCPRLTSLSLAYTPITSSGVNSLVSCGRLQELSLDGTRVDSDAWTALATLRDLRHLSLTCTPIGPRGLEYMAKLDRLQTLYLDGTVLAASYELRDFLKAAGRPIEVSCVFPIEFQESLYKRPGLFTGEFQELTEPAVLALYGKSGLLRERILKHRVATAKLENSNSESDR